MDARLVSSFALVTDAGMNMAKQSFLWESYVMSYGHTQKWDHCSIWQFYLRFLRNLHTIIHSA